VITGPLQDDNGYEVTFEIDHCSYTIWVHDLSDAEDIQTLVEDRDYYQQQRDEAEATLEEVYSALKRGYR
jgi:hypothetical protein